MKALGFVGTAGIELAVSIAVGFFGGRWLDAKLQTEPWLQWIGLALGLVAGFQNLYRVSRKVQRQLSAGAKQEDNDRRDD